MKTFYEFCSAQCTEAAGQTEKHLAGGIKDRYHRGNYSNHNVADADI
jgi:hypothetical protein